MYWHKYSCLAIFNVMKVRGGNTCCTPLNARSHGVYKRSSDGQVIKRYYCKVCKITYSAATFSPLKWQKKRQVNHPLMELLSNNVNLNAAARILQTPPLICCIFKWAHYTLVSVISDTELNLSKSSYCLVNLYSFIDFSMTLLQQ